MPATGLLFQLPCFHTAAQAEEPYPLPRSRRELWFNEEAGSGIGPMIGRRSDR